MGQRRRYADPWLRFFASTRRAQHGPVLGGVRCLLWTASTDTHGYGSLRDSGRLWKAHRWSFHNFVRPIVRKEVVCHRCDIPACVEPAHLFAGTQAENLQDMVKKGRAAKGTSLPQAKLTDDRVTCIQALRGRVPQAVIARAFGVNQSTVSRVCSGEAWRHVRET